MLQSTGSQRVRQDWATDQQHPYEAVILRLGHTQKKTRTQIVLCTFIATLFTITKSWKQPKSTQHMKGSTKRDTRLRWNITQLFRKKLLTHTTWKNLNNMLSEISQSQRGRCYMVPLSEAPRVVKFRKIGSRMVVARHSGKKEQVCSFSLGRLETSRR